MEELQVASLVQDKLIPQLTEPLHYNQLQIFGKTESLNDLGGDYFDLLEIDQRQLAIVLGDVAGHGVGASLIMAYVKSAILQLKELWRSPLKLVNRLNWLLRKTKNKKQKKFMTFQCIVFNSDDNAFEYVNAGHCYPIIVDANSNSTTFCEMINPPLGTSKTEIESSQSYSLESGQALVLYSDGFYETGNIGLEGFKKILLESFNNNPQIFYENVCSKLKRFCNESANDDMTLVIVLNPK
jgi:sigma-B regulation protein RsbU (phosphoserine phosphatase)